MKILRYITAFLLGLFLASSAFAQQQAELEDADIQESQRGARDNPEQAAAYEALREASSKKVRRFHEVLDELLAEFGYDVKTGQIKGLKNVAIRKVRTSKAIPKTYETYIETLLSERIRENSQVRLVSCVPCQTKTSSLVDGKLLITSPATNLARLDSAAAVLGIENFMDAVLVYHTTHMVLAVNVFNVKTKEMVWARTYNSETIKSRYQKLAIDYSQVAKSRPGEDYVPEYRFLLGLGGAAIPNVGGTTDDSSMLNIQVRATEKFNNRKDEFGMLLSIFKSTKSILKNYPTEGGTSTTEETETELTSAVPKPFETAIGLYGLYGRSFIGSVESYNETRHALHVGMGFMLATGYLAPLGRLGWDISFGRRFVTSFAGNYIAPSKILVDGETVPTKGGVGGDVVISFNY